MAGKGSISSNTGKAQIIKQGHTASDFGNDPNVKTRRGSKRELGSGS